jgi:hypothetical protein
MERPCLNDETTFPGEDVLPRHLGGAITAWNAFMELLQKDYAAMSAEWKYYHDGKSWLCKVTRKSKTICWISVWTGSFKTTFYFTSKADEVITNSSLPEKTKQQFLQHESIGKIKPITIEVKRTADLRYVKELFGIKEKL